MTPYARRGWKPGWFWNAETQRPMRKRAGEAAEQPQKRTRVRASLANRARLRRLTAALTDAEVAEYKKSYNEVLNSAEARQLRCTISAALNDYERLFKRHGFRIEPSCTYDASTRNQTTGEQPR